MIFLVFFIFLRRGIGFSCGVGTIVVMKFSVRVDVKLLYLLQKKNFECYMVNDISLSL